MDDPNNPGAFRTLSKLLVGALMVLAFFIFILWRTENPRLQGLRLAVFDVLAPVLEMAAGPSIAAAGLFDEVRQLTELQAENERLRDRVARLRGWRDEAQRLERENADLRALNAVKLPPRSGFVTAEAIGDAGGPYAQSIIVNVGRDDGIGEGAAVLDAGGMVGRTAGVGERAARVLLITDPASRIPVEVGPRRLRALVIGDKSATPRLEPARPGEMAAVGSQVVTSGDGDGLPRGLHIGRISASDDRATRIALGANLERLSFLRILRRNRNKRPLPSAKLIRHHIAEDVNGQ